VLCKRYCFFESHQFRFKGYLQTFVYRALIKRSVKSGNGRIVCISRALKKQWEKALELFNDLHINHPEDKPVRIYVERCKALLVNPPAVPDDWDGVMNLTQK